MELTRNIGWLGILLLGVCCASPYYRAAKKPHQPHSPAIALPEVTSNKDTPVFPQVHIEPKQGATIAMLEPPRLSLKPQPPKPPIVSLPDWANPTTSPPVLDAPPPKLPPVIPVFVSKKSSASANASYIAEPNSQPQRPKIRRHRVVDGDSLRMIALRYYGTEDRANEIISANASILRNPELLPVGQELVIPQP